jgi:glycosyltransferase involved in cell wall biosynthesis
MKHILLVTTSFPDQNPGSEAAGSFVADFAVELSKQVRVTVIAPTTRETALENKDNVVIRRFPVPSLPLSTMSPASPFQWLPIMRTIIAGRKAVMDFVREEKIDHILALWALPSGYWARVAWQSSGVPYSVWALGSDIWSLGKIPIIRQILGRILRDSHGCYADGHALCGDVEDLAGRSCKFLPSSRQLSLKEQKPLSIGPPYRLAFLGRWHVNKGIDLLLDSLLLLTDHDWERIEGVRICGGGPLESAVCAACKSLKGAGRPVNVSGYLDKKAAVDLLGWTDFLLIPSRIESVPIIFSDAMQMNCPIIAMPVGDLPDLVRTFKVGVLAENVSSITFCHAIRQALSEPIDQYKKGLERAREEFDLNRSVALLINELYDNNQDKPAGSRLM